MHLFLICIVTVGGLYMFSGTYLSGERLKLNSQSHRKGLRERITNHVHKSSLIEDLAVLIDFHLH